MNIFKENKENNFHSIQLRNMPFDAFDLRGNIIPSKLFFLYFKVIPSIKFVGLIKTEKFCNWIESQTRYKIEGYYSREFYNRSQNKDKISRSFYILTQNMMVCVEDNWVEIFFQEPNRSTANEIYEMAKKFKIIKKIPREIKLVISGINGLDTTNIKLSRSKLILENQYSEEIVTQHKANLQCLNKKGKSGLMLFHGEPGTGKSTYIRHLVQSIRKNVIFMSPALAANLDTPSLTTLLINNANSIIIIEDAEGLVVSRERERNSGISMLLNLTDGLLGDSLGIQIIATFNTKISNIDKALLRKGRLNSLLEFKALPIEKAKTLLSIKGNLNYIVTKPMTLAEIFNISESDYQYNNERQSIGFLNRAV
jgi:hypothetical protein